MMDQHRFTPTPKQASSHISRDPDPSPQTEDPRKHRPTQQVDIIALVRSLQRTAGKRDCFKTDNADCDVIDCDWRTYCLKKATDRP